MVERIERFRIDIYIRLSSEQWCISPSKGIHKVILYWYLHTIELRTVMHFSLQWLSSRLPQQMHKSFCIAIYIPFQLFRDSQRMNKWKARSWIFGPDPKLLKWITYCNLHPYMVSGRDQTVTKSIMSCSLHTFVALGADQKVEMLIMYCVFLCFFVCWCLLELGGPRTDGPRSVCARLSNILFSPRSHCRRLPSK